MSQLQRYTSKELTHFVGRGKVESEQFALLIHVIRTGWLMAPPFMPHISGNISISNLETISTNEMVNPQMVCFCDIPQHELEIHTNKYSKFGIAFSKDFVAKNGGTPVFYIPRKSNVIADHNLRGKLAKSKNAQPIGGGTRIVVPQDEYYDTVMPTLFNTLNPMNSAFIQNQFPPRLDLQQDSMECFQFFNFRILSYLKFFDHTLQDESPDNYYLEREWRVLNNIKFELNDILRVYIPPTYAKDLRKSIPDYYGQVSFVDFDN